MYLQPLAEFFLYFFLFFKEVEEIMVMFIEWERPPDLTLRSAIQAGQVTEEAKRQTKEIAISKTREMDISLLKRTEKQTRNTLSDEPL